MIQYSEQEIKENNEYKEVGNSIKQVSIFEKNILSSGRPSS